MPYRVELAELLHQFGRERPVLVLQPGNGAVVNQLAGYFKRVIGHASDEFDARRKCRDHAAEGLYFSPLRISDIQEVNAWCAEHGHPNVFWCGSLQRIPIGEREVFAAGLAALLGPEGRLHYTELPEVTASYINNMRFEMGGMRAELEPIVLRKVTSLTGVGAEEIDRVLDEKLFKQLKGSRVQVEVALEDGSFATVEAEHRLLSAR